MEPLDDAPLLVLRAAGGLLAYLVLSSYLTYRHLNQFPGPFLASVSYLYMFRNWLSKRQAASYKGLNQKYNSRLVRIGPNDLITDDPDMIRRMSAARSKYTRSSWYYPMKLNPYDDSLFSMLDAKEHDRLRAKMAFGYGGKEVPDLENAIDEQIKSLVDLIRRKYISVASDLKAIDFATAAQFFTLDTITRIAFGKAFGYLSTEEDVYGYIKATDKVLPLNVVSGEIPWIGKILYSKFALRIIGPKPTDKGGMGKLLGAASAIVAQRFDFPHEKDREEDMLGSFIRHGVSKKECELEIPFQIIAGSDTTATAIRATVMYLTTSRTAYDRLQKEIDEAILNGKMSDPIKPEEAKKMPYLQAVIYEGLRMQIPFSGLIMKEVPPEGDYLDGKFIPGGTRIAHNTLALQRSTSIFGEDAAMFRPERWLEQTPERLREMIQITELDFGHGRWMCLGKPVAFLELNKIYVQLFRNFDFQLVDPLHPWDEVNLNMFLQKNMWVRVTERKGN